jgi:adenylate cyclase
MADVFVSYAREDEPHAKRVAEALRALGYRAWRDDELPPHRTYAEVIEERLNSADAVVALWSANAKTSQWVRAEADTARNLGTLIQGSLDGTIPPIPFNQIQCADLDGWLGESEAPGWRKLVGSIQEVAGRVMPTKDTSRRRSRQQQTSVCVLPFANMSGDIEQEYFSDGITEDITTDLSKVSALAVTARNTAFQFKGRSVDVCEIARNLGVSHVLEGSVRKAGNRLRITAQLIDGSTGDHLWAERYDRDLTDIFEIQDEISSAIVDALKVNLLPEEKKAIEQRGTNSVEAYNLYLMGHNYWVTGNWGDVRQAELVARICERATETDPNYARAWGLLAIAQWALHFLHAAADKDGLAAAERALTLDPNIAEAHIVKARSLYEQGRLAEAHEGLERAVALGPESWEVNHEAGIIVFFQRRFEEAARYFEKAASLDEMDFHSWAMLSSVYGALGDEEGVAHAARMAVSRAERVIAQNPTNGAALVTGATGLALLGDVDRFREWKDRALLVDPNNMIMLYNFACVMARLKDFDGALDLLERRLKTITPTFLGGVLTDPDLDGLRELPRFRAMIEETQRRLGLDTPSVS